MRGGRDSTYIHQRGLFCTRKAWAEFRRASKKSAKGMRKTEWEERGAGPEQGLNHKIGTLP